MNTDSDIKTRVVLRADAGSGIGFGHYVRTVALGAYLRNDFNVVVATRNPDLGHPSDYQRQLAAQSGVAILEVNGAGRDEFDAAFLDQLHFGDVVVLDNYYYSTDYQREVRSRCMRLVCIDDVHDRHFVADLLLTFCPLQASDFSMEPYTEFRGGIEWSFLREPFLAPLPVRDTSVTPGRIALAMGGADPFRLTDKMVEVVRRVLPGAEIDVLAGQTVQTGLQPDKLTRVWRQADAATIAGIFDAADFGIFPASTVCVEAFARRLPVVAGHYVDNQREFYAHGVSEGWFAPLGSLLDDAGTLQGRLADILAVGIPAPPPFNFRSQRQEIINLFLSL